MTPNGPDRQVYARRRRAVLDRLDKGVLFLPAVEEAIYSTDVSYPYRANSNIRYLCGFEEPAALLLANCGSDTDGFTLCVRPRDSSSETWTGRRAGLEDAAAIYGADHSLRCEEAYDALAARLEKAEHLWLAWHPSSSANARVVELVRRVNASRQRSDLVRISVHDADDILGEMRLIKSDEEIVVLRQACAISVEAHRRAMEHARPGGSESQLAALVEYRLRKAGCSGPAYGTIAASGNNATVLHYVRNDSALVNGDLLLLDAGGEYGGYCADITRTFPVGHRFSRAQAQLYDLVLAAQRAAIAAVRPGEPQAGVHRASVEVLCRGMVDLGLLDGPAGDRIEDESYKQYFMHGTSHWLGMDVHDSGRYRAGGESRPLQPGMVLTVEPGIYVRQDSAAPEELRGIGIRIEDDVLVTADGHDVLTEGLPKERGEIEELRQRVLASA